VLWVIWHFGFLFSFLFRIETLGFNHTLWLLASFVVYSFSNIHRLSWFSYYFFGSVEIVFSSSLSGAAPITLATRGHAECFEKAGRLYCTALVSGDYSVACGFPL
jgi:hypothetical protein